MDIEVLAQTSPYFPALLKKINKPPLLLFVKGNMAALQGDLVAVVGTRQPSVRGLQLAYKISTKLVQHDIAVVSGLAEGIDVQAHFGCLQANGKTIAVMAHGLDTIYPAKNAKLAELILQSGGCLISEYPPQTKPEKYTFVQRNRIQSGISKGVIIVESKDNGGSMHTAKFCLKQQRRLAYVALGGQLLLQQSGAMPLRDDKDLKCYIDQIQQVSYG